MQERKIVKRIAILQSNYIPWKGYFDIINSVDEFVIYDDAQYTRRDWRNRNIIKTKNGLKWLTIPIEVNGKFQQKIKDAKVANKIWVRDHLETMKHSYNRSPYFKEFKEFIEGSFQQCEKLDFLTDINRLFINKINSLLGIHTMISDTSGYILEGNRSEKIISICKQAEAGIYLSGPSAKNYIDGKKFYDSNINIEWVNYDDYPEYSQPYPPFNHFVSIIDLIFNQGFNSTKYMKSF